MEFRYTGIKNTRCIGYSLGADVTRVQQFTSESQVALETLVDTLIINAFLSCAKGGKAGFGTSDIKILRVVAHRRQSKTVGSKAVYKNLTAFQMS